MKILALEFSSDCRSVALAKSDEKASASVVAAANESGRRESKPFALIGSALTQASWSRENIDCIAVSLGPGSYAGIRIAISVAQGWQLAREVKLLGISAVECLAHQARLRGITGHVHIAIDAHRNEFYLASGDASLALAQFRESLRLVDADEIQRLLAAGELVIGPDLPSRFPKAQHFWPEAAALAQLAAGRTEFVSGEQLEPIYLRPVSFVKAPRPRIIS